MLKRRLALPLLLLGGAELGLIGCAKELETSPSVDLTKVVTAQFDPSNPIPVLRLVPTPTALVQNPATGAIDKARVAAAECEGATTKQCLQFVDGGWPTTTPITLFFSGDVDEASLANGVVLFEVPMGGAPAPVPLMGFKITPRPLPPAACKAADGKNGSRLGYSDSDVPAGVQVVVTPARALKGGTRYVLFVKSTDTVGPAAGGVRTKNGGRVEPSALFSLMNVPPESAPVSPDGKIQSALLRTSVRGSVTKAVAGNKSESALTDEEKAKIEAGIAQSGMDLVGLYMFFNATISPFVAAMAVNRSELVFANTWSTGSDPTTLEFDPNASKVPFPNNPLLTVTTTAVQGGLRVNLPIAPTDPPTTQALLGGLNTLNGFSTTASISMTFTRDINPMTIDPTPLTPCTSDDCRIVMYPISATGMIDGDAVPLILGVLRGTALAPPTVTIRPAIPLLQNKNYVVAVRRGIEDVQGQKVASAQTFELLKLEQPFVDMMNMVADIALPTGGKLKQALECSFAAARGTLGTAAEVNATAGLLETRVAHPRWIEGFKAIEGASPPIPRTDVLMAFTYKTQTITDTIDLVKNVLISPAAWEMLLPTAGPTAGRVFGPVMAIQGSAAIARLVGVVGQLCVGLCQGGQLPGIMPNQCLNGTQPADAVTNHPLCQTAVTIVTGRLDRASLYFMNSYTALSGGPYQTPDADHGAGTFAPQTVARPRIVPIPIWVVTGTGTPAATGYPIVVFQHGLGSQKEAGFYLANTLAQTTGAMNPAGWATVVMDLPFHGQRASDIIDNATGRPCDGQDGRRAPVNPANVQCDLATGVCSGGCDDRQDPSGSGFLGLNLFATRDAFRQGTIDQLTLLRMLREEGKSTGKLPYLDGTRIAYIGQSLGGITGGNLAAYVTPMEMKAMVLNVPGGGLAQNILPNSVEDIVAPLLAGLAMTGNCELNDPTMPGKGCKDTAAYRRFVTIAEWVLDPGDPLANSIGVRYALMGRPPPLTKEKILIQMSKPDPVVANVSTYALAQAYGIKTDGSDNHFQPYDFTGLPAATQGSGCHAWLLAPRCGRCLIDVLCQTLGAQIQAAQFVNSSAATVTPKTPAMVLPGTPACSNPCPM